MSGVHRAEVPAFAIERHNVTNARFLEFVEAGGYRDRRGGGPEDWQWLQRERVDASAVLGAARRRLVLARHVRPDCRCRWPGPSTSARPRPSAFARWRGARLPTEAEFQRAAFGDRRAGDERRAIPGATTRRRLHTASFDFSSWDPQPAGSHPAGASAWGVDDLVGNGWEWTSTSFAPFPGFRPMPSYPEYSADFFDGEHFVMKGASPATARELLRPTFRNWFRPAIPTSTRPFSVRRVSERAVPSSSRRSSSSPSDVRYYLSLTPRQLPSRYLYDALGSALFEAICQPAVVSASRAPSAICSRAHGREIFAHAGRSRRSSSSARAAARSWRR